MTVQVLPRPVAVSLLPGLTDACDTLDRLHEVPLEDVVTGEVEQATAGLAQLEAQVSAMRLKVLAEADRRHVAEATADTGTDAWAARLTGDTREVMRGGLLLVQDLQDRFHATREAFATGRLSLRQVKVIVWAARQAPLDATPAQIAAAEELMVAKATGEATRSTRPMNPTRLRQAVRRMFDPIDRDLADRHEAILLNREHRNAEASTFFRLSDNGDGTFSGRFTIPELHGHLFKHALERLTAPRRLSRDKNHQPVEDPTVETSNVYELWGVALCEILEHLPTHGHAANGVTLLVTTALDKLRSGLAAAGIDTGTHITSGEARRLACNAGIIPAVLDGKDRPLNLGRKKRLHTTGQRMALSLLYDTCAVAGCERPFAWCEVHHPNAWLAGGPTDLANALPLCGHHHRRAHDDRYHLRKHPGGEWRFHLRR